jgi:prepilin-type N-terminal cleavage/methylation domain-containing protein
MELTKLTVPARTQSRKGFTILEIMIAVVICLVAITGTAAHRYGACLNARQADFHSTAVRTALLFCEGWNGMRGTASFNPISAFSADADIVESDGPEAPDGFTPIGSYRVALDGYSYYVTLSSQNISTDLRVLNIAVNWDPTGRNTGNIEDAIKLYQLTTYVENPI